MFNVDVKFITCDETLHLKNIDFKSFKYETKKRLDESIHDAAKRSYCETRGGNWRAPRPRQIRQLESKLRDKSVIASEWTNESLITIVFSSGAIAYLTVKPSSLDVTQILFDRYCVGKLASPTVTGVVLSSSHIMFAHADRVATLITFGKTTTNSVPCRISEKDPHIQTIELSGGPRRTERRLSWAQNGNKLQVLIWSTATAEPAPWSPVMEDHANLHLYQIDGQQMYLKALHQLENETLLAELSQKPDHKINIVEQVNCHKNGVSLEWTRYDSGGMADRVSKLAALRAGAVRAALGAPARVARLARARLLLACIDGSLHVLHATAGVTHSTRASFIATDVRWCGELILAVEENGRLQCFDLALSVLHHHAKCVDLTSYIRDGRQLQVQATRSRTGGSCILAIFNGGPLAILRITHARLLTAWLQTGHSSNAVALLHAMDWDEHGAECLWALNKLVCAALRSGSAWERSARAAQCALGAFLAPRAPLSRAAARLAPPVHDLARKYFHHLLRRGRADTALSLCVELRAWDLCADARWWAARGGAAALRAEAAALAEHYRAHESDCSDSCSQCSSHSYSTSDAETNDEPTKTEAPPLPRVSLPSYPTVMPVLITQAEPTSTNSIRPNLHQYLERDNTIWNTNVKETNGYDMYKSVLTNNMKSMNINVNNKPSTSKLMVINEVPSNSTTVDIPRVQDDRLNSGLKHFSNMFKEVREDTPLYRYQMNNRSNHNLNAVTRSENGADKYGNRSVEKNKVKFSNTVTVAVVDKPRVCPETERELADSLPLCAPHKYLSAFAPAPPAAPPAAPLAAPPAAGTLDYVEV